ncbi:Microtubule-associated protein RP/EB family member 1B [Hibiscus syriacus]|uniref:Microtubule-associated protein RP/EB family member 1B n=1 Tax=Hibiscus syriacus TaxID=106335 RepID=A0A6A3CKH0_HIBSY|nr:Microtubule-associated protein RP/EB family member 1B [Hibiscus syriacus]
MIDMTYPGAEPMHKVNFDAKTEYDMIQNYKHIEVNRLVKGRPLDNLEFLQWLKRYCDSVNGITILLRHGKEKSLKGSHKSSKSLQANSFHNSVSGDAAAINKNIASKQEKTCVAATVSDVRALSKEITDLKLSVDLLEKERDLYFSKLRDIEMLCQIPKVENNPNQESVTSSRDIETVGEGEKELGELKVGLGISIEKIRVIGNTKLEGLSHLPDGPNEQLGSLTQSGEGIRVTLPENLFIEGNNPPKWWEEHDNLISKIETRMTMTQRYAEWILGILKGRTKEQVQNNPKIEQMLHVAIEDTNNGLKISGTRKKLSNDELYLEQDNELACYEHGIIDVAAFLLERVSDVGSALLLTLSSLNDKFVELDIAVGSTISKVSLGRSGGMEYFNSVLKMEEVNDIRTLLEACIELCQHHTLRLNPEDSELLWVVEKESHVRLVESLGSQDEDECIIKLMIPKSPIGGHILRKLLSQFIKEVVEGMIGYVHLPTIMSKLLYDNGGQEFGAFKLTIFGMLGTYGFERKIMNTAKSARTENGLVSSLHSSHPLAQGSSQGQGNAISIREVNIKSGRDKGPSLSEISVLPSNFTCSSEGIKAGSKVLILGTMALSWRGIVMSSRDIETVGEGGGELGELKVGLGILIEKIRIFGNTKLEGLSHLPDGPNEQLGSLTQSGEGIRPAAPAKEELSDSNESALEEAQEYISQSIDDGETEED